jgi:hypothetical protein
MEFMSFKSSLLSAKPHMWGRSSGIYYAIRREGTDTVSAAMGGFVLICST